MQKLMEYYEEQRKKLFILSVVAWILLIWSETIIGVKIPNVLTSLENNISQSWLSSLLVSSRFLQEGVKILIALVPPTAIVWPTYSHLLKIVDTKCWKQKYPEYDISGEWQDVTKYSRSLNDNGWEDAQDRGKSTVVFKQTCRDLKIQPSDGNSLSWRSIVVYWDDQDELHILYEVQYTSIKQQQGYPESRIGYERMHIDRTGWLSEKQKPHKMCGKFWHCIAQDGKPMYLGDVVYERK